MSSIIKSGRIRSQGIINLSERNSHYVEPETVYQRAVEDENSQEEVVTSQVIAQKKEELAALEALIKDKKTKAEQQAEAILSEAYQKASKVLEDAKNEEAALLAKAHESQEEMLKSSQQEVEAIKQEALEEKNQLLLGAEDEVVETIICLLQHIISDEITYETDWLKFIVHKMLQKQEIEGKVTLLVSPEEYQKLKGQEGKWCLDLSKLEKIEADETLQGAACKLVTSEGSIEYDMAQGLEKVIKQIRILQGLS